LRHYCVQVEGGRFLARRVLHVLVDLRRDEGLRQIELWNVIEHPVKIGIRVIEGPLERVASQVDYVGQTKLYERLLPETQLLCKLLLEYQFVVAHSHRHDPAVIADVEE